MMPGKKGLTLSVVLLAVMLVSGCAKAPTEAEIQPLIEAQYKKSLGHKVGMVEVVGVKKLNCVPAKDKAGFNCDVEIVLQDTIKGEYKETKNIRFIKVDDIWKVAN